jgi:uncharacterized repeat protein (TIGR03803 family)
MKTKTGAAFGLFISALVCLSAPLLACAQPAAFKVLHTFAGTVILRTNVVGASPNCDLVSSGGVLYGTTTAGGAFGSGTVFTVNADGTGLATLYSFAPARQNGHGDITNSDGAGPTGLVSSGNGLYGTTTVGGNSGYGTIFRINMDGSDFTNLYNFTSIIPTIYRNTNTDGAYPSGLTLSGNTLYGTTSEGGTGGNGTVFRINTDGSDFTNLHSFSTTDTPGYTNSDGAGPSGHFSLVGNTLYGTTASGGNSGDGTVFSVNKDGSDFTNLYSFTALPGIYYGTNSDGANPYGGLVLSGTVLYGTATKGGNSGIGTVFSLNTDGTGFTNLYSFNAGKSNTTNYDGAYPHAGLILSGNTLFGTAEYGGGSGSGTVFSINTNGSGFSVLYTFTALIGRNPATTYLGTNGDGALPQNGLVLSGNMLYGTTLNGGPAADGVIFGVNTSGSSFTNLYRFPPTAPYLASSDGDYPTAGLVLAGNTLFCTTTEGGNSGWGTLFSVNTDGSGYTQLHSFSPAVDGEEPNDLALSGDILFGAAYTGGTPDGGTVFNIFTNGLGFTKLYNFTSPTAAVASPTSIILSSNALFGVAVYGGTGYGSVFRLDTNDWDFTNLYVFTATDTNGFNTDGASPNTLSLFGNALYGTSYGGGRFGEGTVFRINKDGSGFTNLYSFTALPEIYYGTNSDGANPSGRLILSGGTLFGTASKGGNAGNGTVFKINTDGTGFTNLYSFTATSAAFTNSDGANPSGRLILADNTLYGTAYLGGSWGYGTIFQINTDGSGFRSLYTFTGAADGGFPQGGVILSGSTLYGTASGGGALGNGTVFSLTLSPGPLDLVNALTENKIILIWPASPTNCILQTSPDLTPESWTDITSGIGMVAGNFIFTNTATGTAFFRLKLP